MDVLHLLKSLVLSSLGLSQVYCYLYFTYRLYSKEKLRIQPQVYECVSLQ